MFLIKYIFIALILAGCGPGGLFLPNIKDYTPEQLDAMKEFGYDAVRCGNAKGPPPSGNVSTVTFPKNRRVKVSFNGCDVHSIEVFDAVVDTVGSTVQPFKSSTAEFPNR